jgi:hypothetical protein
MQKASTTRYLEDLSVFVWPVDEGPDTDVPCRDMVCSSSVAAGHAGEPVPVGTVCLLGVPTLRALLTRMPRVDEQDRHAEKPCLVRYEATKLEEGPVGKSCPLSAPGRYPVSDALEVFEGDSSTGALRLLHERLRDAVVDVLLVPGLTTRDATQLASCSPGSLALQVAASMREATSLVFDVRAAECLSVAINGEVDHAEVDAEEVIDSIFCWLLDLAGGHQEPSLPSPDEVRLSLPVCKQLSLSRAADEGNLDAAFNGPDRDRPVVAEPQESIVVGLGGEAAEGSACLPVACFVGIGDLGDATNNNLGGETESVSKVSVDESVDVELLLDSVFVSHPACVVAGLVGSCKRLGEEVGLLFIRQELELGNQSHEETLTQERRCAIPLPPEGDSILA